MLQKTPLPASYHTVGLALGFSALASGAIQPSLLAAYSLLILGAGLLSIGVPQRWLRPLTRRFGSLPQARRTRPPPSQALPGIALWSGLALVCLLQAVPLPLPWLEALAPRNADIWEHFRQPLTSDPVTMASVSLAPGRSVVEALKMSTYAVIFAVAAQIGASHGFKVIAWLAFFCALAVALVTSGHQLLNAQALYGVYRPLDAPSVAPLFNANNRAGYLTLGFFCGLGLLVRRRGRLLPLLGVGLVVLVAEVLLCQSRGATLSLFVGLCLLFLLSYARKRPSTGPDERSWQTAVVAMIGVSAGLMALLAARERGWKGLLDESLEKMGLFRASARLASDHLLMGVGRGAFGSVFTAYQPNGRHESFDHAENLPLQWLSEWGLVVTLFAAAGLIAALRGAVRAGALANPTSRAGLVGCLVLLLHNFVDLGLEVPAVAALWVFVGGGLCGAATHPTRTDRPARRRQHFVLGAPTALIALCGAAAALWGSDTLPRERATLHQLASSATSTTAFWKRLSQAMQAFPAEPYFPLLGAHSALLAGTDAIPWINQTLRRSPESALAHIELATILQARGATDQALVTLRRAAELDPAQARAVLNLGLSWGLEPERLLRAVPNGPVSSRMLVHLAQQSRDPEQSIRWLKEAETRDSRSAPVQQELAELLYRDLSSRDGAVCRNNREGCLNMAEQYLARGYSPEVPRRRVLTALLLAERGQTGEAETQLEATCRDLPEDLPCAEAFVKLALANQSPRLPAATKRLVAAGCRTTERCAETHLRLGDLMGGRGEWRLALMHYRLATQEVSSPRAWQAVAIASERLRQPGLAAEARRRAHLLSGGGTANK